MLECRDTGVVREGVKESHLVEGPDVREEGHHVVQKLRRKPVANGASLASLRGILAGRAAKMAEQSLPGPGVRSDTWSPDDGVDRRASGGGEEGKKSVEAASLRRIEMREVGIENLKPELWSVFPEVRDLSLVEATGSRRAGE